jgi:hypothetical protein
MKKQQQGFGFWVTGFGFGLVLTLASCLVPHASPAQNIPVRDEGTIKGQAREFNFTGPGVAATVSGGVARVDVPSTSCNAYVAPGTNTIQTAVAALPVEGGVICLGAGTHTVTGTGIHLGDGSTTQKSTRHAIKIIGVVPPVPNQIQTTTVAASVIIDCTGTTNGECFTINGTDSVELRNLKINGVTGTKSAGLLLNSSRFGKYAHLTIEGFDKAIDSTTWASFTPGGNFDNLRNTFDHINIKQGSNTTSTHGIHLHSASNLADSDFNAFNDITISPRSNAAYFCLELGNSDDNIIDGLHCTGGSSNAGITFNYNDNQGPRNNVLRMIDVASAAITNTGTPSGTWHNMFFGFAENNGGTCPSLANLLTIGCSISYFQNLAQRGTTSGVISFLPQAAAGTYNFNWPTSAGSSGQPLLSGGGGATAMSFGTLGVAAGGTGLTTGTSGGVLAFTAAGTLASSGALTANLPVIGGGAGVAPSVGTRSGNTTRFVSMDASTPATNDCAKFDANLNLTTAGAACGSGGTINVLEEDGTPNVSGVTQIKVSNGTLTDNTGGSVSINTAGSGSLDITGLTAADPALGDEIPIYDISAAANRKILVQEILAIAGYPAQGRLSLISGDSTGADPVGTLTPSATDTTAETVDFAAAHGWASGTVVVPTTTVGGLTAFVPYYINATDTDTLSFHTTAADALAATNKVNLTASITAAIQATGKANSTIYWTPRTGNAIALYDGTRWNLYHTAEISLALSALTADKLYDVFLYDNAGTLTLELSAAWASDVARTDALTTQDGVTVKSGAATRRWVGLIRTIGTAATESSQTKRFVWNVYNRVTGSMSKQDATSSWNYTIATYRESNGATTNRLQVVTGEPQAILVGSVGRASNSTISIIGETAIGLDSTTTLAYGILAARSILSEVANNIVALTAAGTVQVPLGYHFLSWLERSNATGTTTWNGGANTGINGNWNW